MRRVLTFLIVPIVAAGVAGCGDAAQVTYVDPNRPEDGAAAGTGGEPFVLHGLDEMERARACIGARSTLAVARTLAVEDPQSASHALERLLAEEMPLIEARAAAAVPGVARDLRAGIEQLRDEPPTDVASYNLEVRRLGDQLLTRACDAIVDPAARQDISFRAGLLALSLETAAMSYEEAFIDGEPADDAAIAAYERAYGLLVDAGTRQLEAVPESVRPRIRATLDRIARSATPGPTPPDSPRDSDLVVGEIAALQDDVALGARIDTTYPEPEPSAPDHLRSLKRAVAAALGAHERGSANDAAQLLLEADRSSLVPAASSVAGVSPLLLAELEHDVLVTLPGLIASGGDVAGAAGDADARIDEAISLIEEELELLREEG